jgi:hypothetical protein
VIINLLSIKDAEDYKLMNREGNCGYPDNKDNPKYLFNHFNLSLIQHLFVKFFFRVINKSDYWITYLRVL